MVELNLKSDTDTESSPPLLPSSLFFKIKPRVLVINGAGEFDDTNYVPYASGEEIDGSDCDSLYEDIEMTTMARYESLTDVLATSPTKTWETRGSWREIPIKDPLVQQAAWAYLMAVPAPEEGGKESGGCCGFIRYLVNDVVVGSVRRWFGGVDDKSSDDGGRRVD